MDLDKLKDNLYNLATEDQQKDMDEIFAREIEIPTSGELDIDSDPDWWDINDYM